MATSLSVPKLTLRAVKGAALTNDEMDQNLQVLKDFGNSIANLLGASLNTDGTLKAGTVFEPGFSDRVVSQRSMRTDTSFAKLSTGAANTYVITFTPAITQNSNGQLFFIAAHQSNTGPVTLQIDLGLPVAVVKLGGLPLLGGEIIAGGIFAVMWFDFGGGGKFYMLHGAPTNPVNTSADSGSGTGGYGIPNGSMETDADADGKPDQWVFAAQGAGTGALDATDQAHSGRSFKFTCNGLGGVEGGGTLLSSNFLEVTPQRLLALSWQMKSSVSGMINRVELDFFTAAQALIGASSPTIIYSSETGGHTAQPSVWTPFFGACVVPSTARYAKVRLVGGAAASPAGSTWFDDVRLGEPAYRRKMQFIVAAGNNGDFTWTAPTGVYCIKVTCIGGGGGGGGGFGAAGGGGGGGGGVSQSFIPVKPGTNYTVIAGAGGTSGAANITGGGGQNSTFNTADVIAIGASAGGGAGAGGGGGAAAVAGTGMITFAGLAGAGASGASGGRGGNADSGAGGKGGGSFGGAGIVGGGGGGGGGSNVGGVGGDGQVIIEFATLA